jgi:hypothetical protein
MDKAKFVGNNKIIIPMYDVKEINLETGYRKPKLIEIENE